MNDSNTSHIETTCAIVGGGPAGAVLSLLLARKGIPVTLLEMHKDFDRDFRGDTLHPSILEIMDEIGLADRLLQLPHAKMSSMTAGTGMAAMQIVDLSHLKTKFPYITMMPQAQFLDFVTSEAKCYPNFNLVMGAMVDELVEDDGVVHGIRYRSDGSEHEVRALLTVGADGRFSRMRKLAGFQPIKASQPIDVVWLRLPREDIDGEGVMGRFGRGHILVKLNRGEQWQIGYVILKGSYQQLRQEGIEALRQAIVELDPSLVDRVNTIQDWKDVSFLSVEADRLPCWHKPGLLLIGDAAHVMSPVGGNGINYAVMDAATAANELSGPLLSGKVTEADLARVQRKREWPTRAIQGVVNNLQGNLIQSALDPNKPSFQVPAVLRWPIIRSLIPSWMGFGFGRVHVK